MSKVKFGETDSLIAEIQQTAQLEKEQADTATRAMTRIRNRIRNFYQQIEYVSFRSAEEAPPWASDWVDYLLDGIVPEPAVDLTVIEGELEPAPVDQVDETPADELPPTPAVA